MPYIPDMFLNREALANRRVIENGINSTLNSGPIAVPVDIDMSLAKLLNKNTTNSVNTDIYNFGKSGGNFYSGTVGGKAAIVPQNGLETLDPGSVDFAKVNGKGYAGKLSNDTDINWGMDGWGGFGLGLGQLGLGLASYLDSSKTAKKQRHLMDQQAAQNDYNMKKTVSDNEHILKIFNPNNK